MTIMKRNVEAGDSLIVKAPSASIYHQMDGDEVKVIAVFLQKGSKEDRLCYAFIHPQLGYGALQTHGFKTPKGAVYKLHTDSEEFEREKVIARYFGCIRARKNVSKIGTSYKILTNKIEYYKNILINNFGFTEETLKNL